MPPETGGSRGSDFAPFVTNLWSTPLANDLTAFNAASTQRQQSFLEETMACPKVVLCGKTIFLLSGYRKPADPRGNVDRKVPKIEAVKELRQSASRHPDAVAFGYVAGRWMPAA
jgi:hypothetical protein